MKKTFFKIWLLFSVVLIFSFINFPKTNIANAAPGSITINSATLFLVNDNTGPGIANISDQLRVELNVINTDGYCNDPVLGTHATVNLVHYGGGVVSLTCATHNLGLDHHDIMRADFFIASAGGSGKDVPAGDSDSEVNITVTDADDTTSVSTTPMESFSSGHNPANYIPVDTIAPIVTTHGTITLTSDLNGDDVASVGDQITYTAGSVQSADGDSWTANLSAYGLSSAASPGIYTIPAGSSNGAFSATEKVTDNGGNTASGQAIISGFTHINNFGVTSATYTVNSITNTIIGVSSGTSVTDFSSFLTPTTGATFVVYKSDGATPATDPVVTGDKVIVTAPDAVTTKTYTITLAALIPGAIDLGTASNFAILSKTAITDAHPSTSSITGNVGVSPATGASITGLSCLKVTGKIYDVDGTYTGGYDSNISCLMPGPGANKTLVDNAVGDMVTAYNNALIPATTVLDAGTCVTGTCDLAGTTLAPGVYTFDGGGNVIITDDMHLSGGENGVWIFKIPGTLDISSAKKIILSGGAQASNIFWAVAGTTTLETTSTFEGDILAGPATSTIAMQSGATLDGRALGQKDVTLIGNTISIPTASSDATLSDLTISSGTLSPVFSPGSGSYSVSVPYNIANVTITPTASEAHASITVNTIPVASGATSVSIPLNVGSNLINVGVTAQDASTNSYGITITRAQAPSSGSSGGGYLPGYGPKVAIPAVTPTITFLTTPAVSPASTISKIQKVIEDLISGTQSKDVNTLQLFLISQNKGPAARALKKHGATDNFGKLTKAALVEWQKIEGIIPATGNFGPKTRGKIKKLGL